MAFLTLDCSYQPLPLPQYFYILDFPYFQDKAKRFLYILRYYPRHAAVHGLRVSWSQAGRVVGGLASPALQDRLEGKITVWVNALINRVGPLFYPKRSDHLMRPGGIRAHYFDIPKCNDNSKCNRPSAIEPTEYLRKGGVSNASNAPLLF